MPPLIIAMGHTFSLVHNLYRKAIMVNHGTFKNKYPLDDLVKIEDQTKYILSDDFKAIDVKIECIYVQSYSYFHWSDSIEWNE